MKSRTIILLLVLHGWALTLRNKAEDVCEYGAEKVGHKRDEWDRGVEETACEDIRDLYFSPNIMWVMAQARTVERSGAYRVLVGRPEEKGPPGKPRRRWKDNIKMDLQKI